MRSTKPSDAYFERSPSGTGLRGFFKLSPDFAYDKTIYYINNRKHGLEVYLPGTTNRFVTVTGDVYRNGTVSRNDEALQTALDTFMKRATKTASAFNGNPISYFTDEQVIKHASESRSGDKFTMLYEGRWEEGYDSQSDADMAFVSMLCFWCGCVEEQIDRIFRTSGLMRDKWDRRTGDATYGEITIRNAIASCSEIYRPVSSLPDEDDILLDFTDLDADPAVTVDMSAFDRDKYLFNCHNGTINLLTSEFRPHSPADMLTKMTEVDYVPDAVCDRWLSFMDEVMEGDKERIKYLQKAIGYAMSGDTRLECMFILYGATSRNGKGTTMETILRILGEYGRTAKPDMLSKKSFADPSGPSEDVARLNGARMVNVSEPERSMQIDARLTKQMTGNNILTARSLRENSFEFKPQFKLFIDTNHLPQISDMALFGSDRIKIIPFDRHFTAEERDIDLKSFFAKPENLSGILNWCLEGSKMYMQEGLDMPDSVENATREYRQRSDRIMMYTSQCMRKEIGQELRAASVYNRYKSWCAENGFKYENAANFRKKMEQAGYIYQRRRPKDEAGACTTTMVNDIAWVAGEEPETDLVPVDDAV